MRARLVLGVALAVAQAAPVRGQTGGFLRYLGGGARATDCMLVADVAGADGRRAARCTDGDPRCDADGVADGTCRFAVRLCLDAVDPAVPRCHADVVTGASANDSALAAALATLSFPVSAPETCTAAVPVAVARRARTVVLGRAAMASGHSDRDRVRLVCRRPPPPVTFVTLERKIFGARCATLSCHGAARAGRLGLEPGFAYDDLVGVAPDNAAARDAGLLRVTPGDPDRSFLLHKLEGTLSAGQGDRMPQLGRPVGRSSIDLIRRWIAAGAPRDAAF